MNLRTMIRKMRQKGATETATSQLVAAADRAHADVLGSHPTGFPVRVVRIDFGNLTWPVRYFSMDDIRFMYPQRGGNEIHGRGMQGRWLRAIYARLEPWGA